MEPSMENHCYFFVGCILTYFISVLRSFGQCSKGIHLPYVQGVSELVVRHTRPYNFKIAHKPTESLRKTREGPPSHVETAECRA